VDALDKALTMRRLIAVGKDSIEERDREQQVTSIAPALTFEKCLAPRSRRTQSRLDKREAGRAMGQHARDLRVPKLGGKPLDAITPTDCAEVLRPIWLERQAETACPTSFFNLDTD
jgi:hypothetical protein